MAVERSRFLEYLENVLRGDVRIVAAWVGGSIGRGKADDLSDIDIHLAVADEYCVQLNSERRAFVAQFGGPITGPGGAAQRARRRRLPTGALPGSHRAD
jgi:hypothetical protein